MATVLGLRKQVWALVLIIKRTFRLDPNGNGTGNNMIQSALAIIEELEGFGSNRTSPVKVIRNSIDVSSLLPQFAKSSFQIVSSSDGDVSVVQDDGNSLDYSKRSGFFDLHQDGLDKPELPEFGLLRCDHPGQGSSPTVFCDCAAVLSDPLLAEHLSILKRLDHVYLHKSGNEFVRPLVEVGVNNELFLNFGSRVYLRPRTLATAPSIREQSAALAALVATIDKHVFYRHFWRAGDIVVFDNRRTLHGRQGAARDLERRLTRILFSNCQKQPAMAVGA